MVKIITISEKPKNKGIVSQSRLKAAAKRVFRTAAERKSLESLFFFQKH